MGFRRRRALIITPEVRATIAAAIDRARADPVPLRLVMQMMPRRQDSGALMLEDRKPGAPERPPSQSLLIPNGYQVAFSFEEQPFGLVRHMSVALDDNPGKLPSPESVKMIAEEFGFRTFPPDDFGRVWIEEFRPGLVAINLAELVDPPTMQITVS